MSPTKANASESTRPKKITPSQRQRPRKAFKQRKIPKTLDGVPVYIYGATVEDFVNGDATIQPRALVASEPAPSHLHVTTPQDTVNLASPPADFVHPQILASTQVYLGPDPSGSDGVPTSFQYDLDDLNASTQADDIFPLTNNPCQSYASQYDLSYLFLPQSGSASSLSMEDGVGPYHWQQLPDPHTQYTIPQPNLSYISHASSTFPGNSVNNIYAELPGFSESHLMMTSANLNDGTLTAGNTLSFPNYDPDSLYSY